MERQEKRTLAKVFSFDVRFIGTCKTMFYRELFGYTSALRRGEKTYMQQKPGLLGRIPHVKLGKSVIAVPNTAAPHLNAFFSNPQWQPIELHSFDAILPTEVRTRAMEGALERLLTVKRGERVKLIDEIMELSKIASQRRLAPELAERARNAVRAVEELMEFDWTDGQEFSRGLEPRLSQLKRSVAESLKVDQ